eukprot:TRINITY_DN7969_c0_g1_i4.p1 TRINITY_DN7969_c0_g1~~TRINITY_DN7969_c0_g1_i4.p1  ORF type:complete len:228 (+),score=26.67 TRINITY_DN7969_c0_g1_i4:151-834(+)
MCIRDRPPSAARRAADFIPNRTRASSLTVDPTQPIEATVYTGPRVQAAQIALQPAQPAAAPIPPARQCKCGAPLHAPQDEQLVRCAQCGKVSQLRSGSGSVGSVEAMVPGMVHVNCPACSTLLAYAQREIPEAHCTVCDTVFCVVDGQARMLVQCRKCSVRIPVDKSSAVIECSCGAKLRNPYSVETSQARGASKVVRCGVCATPGRVPAGVHKFACSNCATVLAVP